MMKLKSRKALVFGGTSGIGLAACRLLAAGGAKVVAISRDPGKAGKLPTGVTTAACDVRDREALAALFAAEAPFDILVNAATGGKRAVGPFLEMDLDGYQASFDKLWGYANTVRLGAQHLAGDGCIVLVSGAPARRPKPGQIALSSVGGAVEQFARALAPEIAPRRINVVSPGTIDTPMFGPDTEARAQMLEGATARQLIPRAGTAEEVATAILFAIENEFVTGTTIDVDGGWLLS
jgi:NAD(P)-dependent dehydrogenase (short-subunit alcohol dehydrogenase family)